MVNAYLGILKALGGGWVITQPIVRFVDEAGPDPPNRVVALMSPYVSWARGSKDTVAWWAAAALAAPYTEEVGQSVANTLLQIASNDVLMPHIPITVWAWLKKKSPLPPIRNGWLMGTVSSIVRAVRELEDVEILESYLLLVWSEWNFLYDRGFDEMCTSIREDLGGIEMGHHREVLIKRLDHLLERLDGETEHLDQHQRTTILGGYELVIAKRQYGGLKDILLEVDRKALEILTRTPFSRSTCSIYSPPRIPTESHSTFVCALPLPCP